jgi:hypothetical protein
MYIIIFFLFLGKEQELIQDKGHHMNREIEGQPIRIEALHPIPSGGSHPILAWHCFV